jgi:hypothetical protein
MMRAMRVIGAEPMGGAGDDVEIDETIVGKLEGAPKHIQRGGTQWCNIVIVRCSWLSSRSLQR